MAGPKVAANHFHRAGAVISSGQRTVTKSLTGESTLRATVPVAQ